MRGSEGDGGLFAGGQEHVHFALAGIGGDVPGKFDEVVRDSAHGGNNDNHLVALRLSFNHAARNVEDAFRIADGRAAIFLDNESHGKRGTESHRDESALKEKSGFAEKWGH